MVLRVCMTAIKPVKHFIVLPRFIFALFLFSVFSSAAAQNVSLQNLAENGIDTAHAEKEWIPSWKPLSSMTIARAGSAAVSNGDRIYMIGGVDGVNFLSTVESAVIDPDGSLSSWSVVGEMPEPRGFMSAVIHANRIYVVGGGNGPYGKKLLNSIVSAPILTNGLLGKWRTEKEQMLTPRRCSKLIVKDDVLHVFGGFGGALLDTVESSHFSKNGELKPWSMQINRMTMPRYVNEVKRVDDYAVVIGGHHPTKGMGVADVEYADLKENVLTWRTMASMNEGRYAFGSAAHEQYVYAFGGISGAEYLNSSEKFSVAFAKNSEIESNKWSKSTDLPAFMANFTTLVVGGRIYLIGGSTRYQYMSNVWTATFNASGDVGYFGTQQEFDGFNASAKAKISVTKLPNSGTVLESIETDGYTYLRVSTSGKEIWLAAPKIKVSLNTKIGFSEGVYMSNFRSKSLNRNFAAILFVGTVRIE